MIAVGHTIAGAASGETACMCGAEGFTISGKRTEEYEILYLWCMDDAVYYFSLFCYSFMTMRLERIQSLFFMDFLRGSLFQYKIVS